MKRVEMMPFHSLFHHKIYNFSKNLTKQIREFTTNNIYWKNKLYAELDIPYMLIDSLQNAAITDNLCILFSNK